MHDFEKCLSECFPHLSFWRRGDRLAKITYIFLLRVIEAINLEADCMFSTQFITGMLKGACQNNI